MQDPLHIVRSINTIPTVDILLHWKHTCGSYDTHVALLIYYTPKCVHVHVILNNLSRYSKPRGKQQLPLKLASENSPFPNV